MMRLPITMLAGVTKANRHQVSADINDAVIAAGGWVSDHTFFSNIATTFRIVLVPAGIARFRDLVTSAGIHLDEESEAVIQGLLEKQEGLPEEIPASLNVTFIHDEPDLRRAIPAVPG